MSRGIGKKKIKKSSRNEKRFGPCRLRTAFCRLFSVQRQPSSLTPSRLARDIFFPASAIILSMTIKNQLNESMKDAMRSGDEVRKQLSGK